MGQNERPGCQLGRIFPGSPVFPPCHCGGIIGKRISNFDEWSAAFFEMFDFFVSF